MASDGWSPRPTRSLCWCREGELNPTRGEPRRILRAWKGITGEYSRLRLSASDAVFRDMQITVERVGDVPGEACSRHNGVCAKRFISWYGTQGHCFRACKENTRTLRRAAEKNVRTG